MSQDNKEKFISRESIKHAVHIASLNIHRQCFISQIALENVNLRANGDHTNDHRRHDGAPESALRVKPLRYHSHCEQAQESARWDATEGDSDTEHAAELFHYEN